MDEMGSIYGTYLNNYSVQKKTNNEIEALRAKKDKLSSGSTEEDMREAAKTFEAYFVEQIMKQVAETTKSVGGKKEDSQISMMKEMHMDGIYKEMSQHLVERYGSRFTEDMVAQMKRNYGIKDTAEKKDGTDSD